jgi:Zn-dependent protease
MEHREARDILVSALALAFVFSWRGFGQLERLTFLLPASVLAVSAGFVLHEMGHRWLAKKLGAYAEYRMWRTGLALALLLSIATSGSFVFAAPGAVVIHQRYDLWGHARSLGKKSMSLIGGIGPVINIVLAVGFLAAFILARADFLLLGASINAWLALFNMIPVPPLDGSKVWAWRKDAWAAIIAVSAGLLFASGML